jgi:hypothetical protein
LFLILHDMGASTAETPTSPDGQPAPGLRASDAERDQVVSRLRDEYVAGRLSQDTFMHRVDLVLGSRHQAELPPVLDDLPVLASLPVRLRAAWSRVAGLPRRAAVAAAPGPRRDPTTSMAATPGPGRPLLLPFPRSSGRRFSIGRDAACDLAIADLTVSRRHAQLERSADGWLLTDLESTNGTRVNGWRVRGHDRVPVGPGDRVTFGDQEVVFLRGDAPPALP